MNGDNFLIPNNLPKRNVITALLLGDGGIAISNRNRPNPSPGMFYTCASVKFKDYYEWKKGIFREAVGYDGKEYKVENSSRESTKKSSDLLCYQYFSVDLVRPYANFLLSNYKKQLPKFLLRMHHPLCLAIWFMDDGNCQSSISKHRSGEKYLSRPYFRLATNQFDYSQHEYAVKWFADKWGVRPSICRQIEKRFRDEPYYSYTLRFSANDTEKIWGIIRPYISQVDSMMWKFRFSVHFYDYKGSNKDLELSTVPRIYKEKCGMTYTIG